MSSCRHFGFVQIEKEPAASLIDAIEEAKTGKTKERSKTLGTRSVKEPMYRIIITNKYDKDIDKCVKRGLDLNLLEDLINSSEERRIKIFY